MIIRGSKISESKKKIKASKFFPYIEQSLKIDFPTYQLNIL